MKVIHIQGHNRMFETHVSPSSTLKKIENYVFDLNKVLGVGNFSKVYHGSNQLTNQTYAIKVVEMERMRTGTLSQLLKSECEILQTLKHPNVLNCIEIFNSRNNCYIVTELCNDGDLESMIRKRGPLDENSAKKIIYETYSGLKYLNESRIIHRDFKVANVFMNDGVAKIADFGFAKRLKYPEEVFTDVNIGSPIYMSPESLVYHRYGAKTDVWAFGVFLFEILHGDTPLFFCKSEADLRANIGIPIKQSAFSPYLSAQLKNLIMRCLDVDERRRISMAEMANHPYILHLKSQFELRPLNLTLKISESTNANSVFIPEPRSKITSYVNTLTPDSMNLLPSVSHKYEPPSPNRAISIQFPKQTSQTRSPNRIIRHKVQGSNFSEQYLSVRSKSLDRTPTVIQNNLQHKISTPVQPQQEQNYYTPNTTATIIKHHLNTQPSQLTGISSKSNVNVNTNFDIEIQPTQVIVSSLTFAQCVHLLHYCRLTYKCVMMAQKENCYLEADTFLVNWLLSLLKEIKNKENLVRIEGDRASVRQKKLKDVINQYQSKYIKQLQHYVVKNPNLSPEFIRDKLKSQLVVLCQRYETEGATDEIKRLLVYLEYLGQCTVILLECVRAEDFGRFGVMKIEDFLSKMVDVGEVDIEKIKCEALI